MTVLRLCTATLLLACSFDASGQGEVPTSLADGTSTADTSGSTATPATTGGQPGTSTSTAGVTGTATGDATTGPIDPGTTTTATGDLTTSTTTTDPSTSSTTAPGTTTTGDDTTTTTSTTTGPQPCQGMFIKEIELVTDASVMAPMETAVSGMNEGTVAYSEVAEQGTVTFTFDIGCSGGAFAVWGRVLDGEPGVNNYDPDSYYVRADGGPEAGWFYGCQTGQLQDGYHWLRVRTGAQGDPCDSYPPWTLQLAPGPHTITLRNREPVDGMDHVAAVARLLVTNDPDYVPNPPD